jgi:hypothetical protein
MEFDTMTHLQSASTIDHDEPVGIVISPGAREEILPRFSAYVWGPASEPAPPTTNTVRAA